MRQSAAELQVNIGEHVTVVVPLTSRIFSIYWSAAECQYLKEKFKKLNFNIENNSPKNKFLLTTNTFQLAHNHGTRHRRQTHSQSINVEIFR